MSNNIQKIDEFLSSDETCLLINQVGEEIGCFYLTAILYLSNKQEVKVSINSGTLYQNQSEDLFETKKVKIFNSYNSKEIDKFIKKNDKQIIISDYKNYKKYQKSIKCLNGYENNTDIKYFLNMLGISNADLINYCLANPMMIYSETSKYLINNKNYSEETSIIEKNNFILNIRKKIFNNKRSGDIRETFLNIKDEAKYKKLNFLTY